MENTNAQQGIIVRDKAGKFLPGTRPPPRPPGSLPPGPQPMMQALRQEFLAVWTPERMGELAKVHHELLHSKSERIRLEALRLAYDRLFGKAIAQVDLNVQRQHSPFSPELYTDEAVNRVMGILSDPDSIKPGNSHVGENDPSEQQQ